MKLILLIVATILFHVNINAQTTTNEIIECLGETIVVVNGDDVQTTRNSQNAAIYTFNMEDSSLTIKSISRTEGVSQDQFLITRKVRIGGKDVYDLASPYSQDKSTYGVSVDDINVELMIFVNGRTITVTSPIARKYNQQITREKSFPTKASFLIEGDKFYTHLLWSEKPNDSISIWTELSGENKVKVKYVDKALNEITIYLNDPDIEFITIDDFGNSNLGKYIGSDYPIDEVCDAIQSLYRTYHDYHQDQELKNKIKLGQRLQAFNFTTFALKTSGIGTSSTTRAKLVSKVCTSFTIGANSIAAKEDKSIYVQLVSSDSTIYQSSSNRVFTTINDTVVPFSGKKVITYSNNSLEIAVYINIAKAKLSSGTYKIQVYCDGYLIGTDRFTLR